VKNARPDGFEPPTTWFEVRYTDSRIIKYIQSLTIIRLCYAILIYLPVTVEAMDTPPFQ
jgi:hypothetical protein